MKPSTPQAQSDSRPVRFELVNKDGEVVWMSNSANYLAGVAKRIYPDQEQDEDRTGKGWDIQVVGS